MTHINSAISRWLRVGGLFFVLSLRAAAQWVQPDMVPVGNLGNTGNTFTAQGGGGNYTMGSVSYDYYLSTTEVTVGQWANFLNAVATVPNGNATIENLWNSQMGNANNLVGGISRTGAGTSGNPYSYAALMVNGTSTASYPITYVSWNNAARLVNWLSTGGADTETGTYNLGSGNYTRQPGATWWLPSQNEWYKAAYYSGANATYFAYTTQSNSLPAAGNGTSDPATPNQANYSNLSSTNPVTTTGGYFTASSGPYGTFDQGGNVNEWIDSTQVQGGSTIMGGSWSVDASNFQNNFIGGSAPLGTESNTIGFRLASSVPEPSAALWLLVPGLLGLGLRPRKSLPSARRKAE